MSLDVYLHVPREQHEPRSDWWDLPPCCGEHPPDGADPGGPCVPCAHCNRFVRPHRMGSPCPAGVRVYSSNITHNLNRMAEAAGVYEPLWRPEEVGITKAGQLVPLLREGLAKLRSDRAYYETFNAPNGWGLYEHFVPWVNEYLQACEEYPEAAVSVSR